MKKLIVILFILWANPAFAGDREEDSFCKSISDSYFRNCEDVDLNYRDTILGSSNCITGKPYIEDKAFKCIYTDAPEKVLTLEERKELIAKHEKFYSKLNECENPTTPSERRFVSYDLMRVMTNEDLNCFLLAGKVFGETIPSWIIAIDDVPTKVFIVENYVERDIPRAKAIEEKRN